MTFVAARCPQCAGALQVPDDRDTVKCMYCGVDVVVRQAIQLVSGNSKNFLELAKTASASGNYAEAYDYFTRVLEIEPTNPEAWFGKGTAAGWQSSLIQFRFTEMLLAYGNGIRFSTPDVAREVTIACAHSLNEVATACYAMSRKHVLEFITVPNSWIEYLPRCRQIISLYEAANSYQPDNRMIIENIIHVCKDNIEGVKYNDPYDNNRSKSVYLSDEYEREIRGILNTYAGRLKVLDPNYIPPNPKRQSPDCFVVTATMGNEEHPAVLTLRSFRDELLVKSVIGSAFVTWYCMHGPSIARRVEASAAARLASYLFIVAPAAGVAAIILHVSRKLSQTSR